MADIVEVVARAIFLKEGRARDVAWEDADKVLALVPWTPGERRKVSDYYRSIARAALTALEEAGWAVVPREPTSGKSEIVLSVAER